MAVFLINICKFNGCEKIFPNLNDLIQHIEDTHIDHDAAPGFQPEKAHTTCLPLSYVLRFVPDRSRYGAAAAVAAAGTPAPASSSTNGTNEAGALTASNSGAGGGTPPSINAAPTSKENNGVAGTGPGGGGGGEGGANNGPHSTSSSCGGSSSSCNCTICCGSCGNGLEQPSNGHDTAFPSGSTHESAKIRPNQSTGGGGGGAGGSSGTGGTTTTTTDLKRKIAIKHHSYSLSVANRSTTPTGSEMDDDEMMVSESEDSNDSWTTEEFSSEFIMRYGSRRHSSSGGGNGINSTNEKPFACPVPGCKKRYKNVNGIKYHSKNGHKKDGNRVRKAFKCYCGKSYKTSQRLKNHNMVAHAVATSTPTDGATLAAVPLASPALPSATSALLVTPVKSPPSLNGSSCSSTNTSLNGTIVGSPSIPSSQIGTNVSSSSSSSSSSNSATIVPTTPTTTIASPSSTSPSTLSITPHKVPRAGSAGNSIIATTTTGTATLTPTTTTTTKYDNLGILTPATSPKLIGAGTGGGSIGPESGAKTNQHQVVSSSTTPGSGAGTGAGETVGIALLVSSSSAGTEPKLLNGTTTVVTTGPAAAAATKTGVVLAAPTAAGQLFADET